MKTIAIVILTFMLFSLNAFAQEWVKSEDGGAVYDCELIAAIASDFGARAVVRLEGEHYSVSAFFAILVPNCQPAIDPSEKSASAEHEPDWKRSNRNESEYDCALLSEIFANYGENPLVIGATDARYSVSEVFISFVPNCDPDFNARDLLERIGDDEGWVKGNNSEFEYNCEFVSLALAEYGDLDFVRIQGQSYTLNEYYLQMAPLCNVRTEVPAKVLASPLENEWIDSSSGDIPFNCAAVRLLLSEYGVQNYLRGGGTTWTSLSYFQRVIPDCVPGHVVTIHPSNVHECAASDCPAMGRVEKDTVLPVVGVQDPWYEVAVGDETGFIAVEHTSPGGYPVLQGIDGHYFEAHDCVGSFSYQRGSGVDIDIVALFEKPNDSAVTIYRPLEEIGVYVIEVSVGDAVERIGLDASVEGAYEFLVGGC